MRESRERSARIPDVNQETFARFMEFVYTGDYNSPQPEPVQQISTNIQASDNDEHKTNAWGTAAKILPYVHQAPAEPYEEPLPEPVSEPPEPEIDPWRTCAKTKKDMKKQKAMAEVQATSCDQKRSKLPDPDISVAVTCPLSTSSKIRRNIVGRNDYTAVFFCHAQLYVLGDKYDVKPLKALSSERLSRSFRHYERAETPFADFPGLVRYVFEHTPERITCDIEGQSCQSPHKSSGDILQQICVHFAANNFESLILSSGFCHLLREGGLFVEMFVAYVAERFGRMQ
jgi:hypothetical protein